MKKRIIGACLLGLLATTCGKAKQDYKLTKEQSLTLQLAQSETRNAQIQLSVAQQQFNVALAKLQSTATDVIITNRWSPNTNFDPNTLKFSDAPVVPTPKDVHK